MDINQSFLETRKYIITAYKKSNCQYNSIMYHNYFNYTFLSTCQY